MTEYDRQRIRMDAHIFAHIFALVVGILLMLLWACGAFGAEPEFTVINKTTPQVAFTVVNKATPAVSKYDPYKMEYREFYVWIGSGGRGVLVVGIPDRYVGGYENHCWVPSGFAGLKDGEYDCFGKNEMTPRKSAAPAVAAPGPFLATTQDTTARRAAVRSTSFLVTTVTEPIRIGAPLVGPFGTTNCPPLG